MRRVSVIVPKEQLHTLLAYVGQQEAFHLVEVDYTGLPEGASRYEVTSILARSSAIRNRVLALNSALGTANMPLEKINAPVQNLEALTDFLDAETSKLEQRVRQLEDSAGKIETEKGKLAELSRFLASLENAGIPLDSVGEKGLLTLMAGEVSSESLESIRRQLDEVTYGNLIFAITGPADKTQAFIAVFPSSFSEEARQSATALGSRLEPSWADLPTDPAEARKRIGSQIEELDSSSKQLQLDKEKISSEIGPRAKTLGHLSELLDVRAKALGSSSITESTCMLRAWVPEDRLKQFTEGVEKACEGLVAFHLEEPSQSLRYGQHSEEENGGHESVERPIGETPPSLVRVPRWASPLQGVINNFGIPSYNELNPLPIMLISYPIIYGLMFGDAGQGPIFILLGFLFLRFRQKGTKVPDVVQILVNGAELFILLGIGITAFGIVFGDFFGFENVLPIPAFYRPLANLQQFMVITLFIGVAHYTFGLSLSAYNKIHSHHLSEAFFGPICWVWFYLMGVYLISQVVLAGFKFGILLQQPALIALAVIPLVLMGWKEGGLHAFEAFLSAPSNTFSYLRIWALNIADFYFKSALFIAGGLPGAVLGNLLVMIIEGLIVFVQTLRLHWVEWFSKFYEGAGLSFAPYQEPKGWIVPA